MGCPKGTVQSRLARARQRLQVAFQRRGLGISAESLGEWIAGQSLTLTSLTPVLVATTIYSAVLLKIHGLSGASLSPGVADLMAASNRLASSAGKKTTLIGIAFFSLLLGAGAFISLANRSFSFPPAPSSTPNAAPAAAEEDAATGCGCSQQ
jgi:hypothetical protein